MHEVVIVDAVRTPIGKHGGSLSSVRADDLAAISVSAIIERSHLDPALVEEVYLGCANQAGEDNRNVARMALLLAGLPHSVGGVTFNRLCASGLAAVSAAARAIAAGEGDVYIAGGVENMTRAPFSMPIEQPLQFTPQRPTVPRLDLNQQFVPHQVDDIPADTCLDHIARPGIPRLERRMK